MKKISYEGYSQLLCKNGHNWNVDCNEMPQEYEEPRDMICPKCKEPEVWENMVNVTNGSWDDEGNRIDGFIELEVEGEISGECSCCGGKHVCDRIYKIPKKSLFDDVIMCKFCGEAEAVTTIPNPNMDGDDFWDVCEGCEEYIKDTHMKDFEMMIETMGLEVEDAK